MAHTDESQSASPDVGSGEPVVEERELLSETVERVVCRWCGRADSVEVVPRPAEPGAAGAGAHATVTGEPVEHPARP